MEWKGCISRIKEVAFDLLSMDELLGDGDDSWEFIEKFLGLKATFLYIDLSRIISKSDDEQKKILNDLTNSLFYYLDELRQVVKKQSIPMAQECHHDVAQALRELMSTLKIKPRKEKKRLGSCHDSQDQVTCSSSSSS